MDDLPHYELSSTIIGSCFEVINEIGVGFLETVYKNALLITLRERGLHVEIEKTYEIHYKSQKIGRYIADMVVDNKIIVELKCCKVLLPEHQAQTINYLTVANLPV